MSGFKNKLSVIADPANIFGKRGSGMVNWADMIDPGGKIIKEFTGRNLGRKVADPLKLYSTGKVDEYTAPELTYEEKRAQRLAREKKAADAQRRKRQRSILTTEIEEL